MVKYGIILPAIIIIDITLPTGDSQGPILNINDEDSDDGSRTLFTLLAQPL
jgi:hypothetical protein